MKVVCNCNRNPWFITSEFWALLKPFIKEGDAHQGLPPHSGERGVTLSTAYKERESQDNRISTEPNFIKIKGIRHFLKHLFIVS
jgi:hypothetical protein